ncbi:MAG: alpha/beta hydrolase [Armatimonadetes bacterium]|nr:alpha/beta hydrolase [Armatimonadota bacterium]
MYTTTSFALIFALISIAIAAVVPATEKQTAPTKSEFQIPDDIELIKDIPYSLDGNEKHRLDILRLKKPSKDPMPVIVWIHGGGFRGGSKTSGYPRLIRFVRRGYLGVTIDYRFSTEKIFPAQIHDCKCAIRFLRAHSKKYNLDPERIGVWGASAGGYLVSMLGTTGGIEEFEGNGGWQEYSSRVQAVVDFYGMTDFLAIEELVKQGKATERFMIHDGKDSASGLLGGPFWENPELCRKASPTTYASKDDPPFYIFHGDNDPLTPHSQSQLLHDVLRKAGVDSHIYIVKGGKHGWPSRPDVDEKIDAFFDKHLLKKKPSK